jgi:predicted RNase H-like nuclease (RuvC/YqgF family)
VPETRLPKQEKKGGMRETEQPEAPSNEQAPNRGKTQLQDQRLAELAADCAEMQAKYSALAQDCLALKQREAETFDNYITACQTREKLAVDSKQEISHQRVKIKLLQDALTKRNQEYEKLQKRNKELVTALFTHSIDPAHGELRAEVD